MGVALIVGEGDGEGMVVSTAAGCDTDGTAGLVADGLGVLAGVAAAVLGTVGATGAPWRPAGAQADRSNGPRRTSGNQRARMAPP